MQGCRAGNWQHVFVLPIEDSMPSIFEDAQKRSCDPAEWRRNRLFVFATPSRNRSGQYIRRSGQRAGFIHEDIQCSCRGRQAGRGATRREHGNPARRSSDVIDFIRLKRNPTELVNFNVSVAVTDAFMEAVRQDAEYPLINPRTGLSDQSLRASRVFDELVESAWMSGDPGIVFIDRMNEQNPTPISATTSRRIRAENSRCCHTRPASLDR